jgi:hypothetical protein
MAPQSRWKGKGAAVLLGCLLLAPAHSRHVAWTPPSGIYSNEEQVYFDKESGRETPWVGLIISDAFPTADSIGVSVNNIDVFGQKSDRPIPKEYLDQIWDAERSDGRLRFKSGKDIILLRRARPVTCWAAIPKTIAKPDGSPDYYFARDIKIHDQGGRARIGGGETGAPETILRMRNVVWPDKADGTPNSNRPSVVLYVHKPDKPDSAEAYAWADPGAVRVGINLRWMQASCTIDSPDAASQVSTEKTTGQKQRAKNE